jgi:SPX domain protein involved in polyphosphate accumulation
MQEQADFPDGRYERKYLLPDRIAVAVRDALRPHLDMDSHTPAGQVRGYQVYSLYFDNSGLDLYLHTRRRLPNRFKLRVRFYDRDAGGKAYVEVKEKADGLVHKRRYSADRALVEALVRDPSCEAVSHALGNGARGTAFEEFCRRMKELGAGPKLFLQYEREAYNSKELPHVRVTFDRRIKTMPGNAASGLTMPTLGTNIGGLNVLLEIKYAGEPPEWLTKVVTDFRLRRASFSKFAEGVDVLGISGAQPPKHRLGVKKNPTSPA